jgi:hypothetical protein
MYLTYREAPDSLCLLAFLALLYKLTEKGTLSADEAKSVLQNARKAVGDIHLSPQDRVAATVLDDLIARFPDSLHK